MNLSNSLRKLAFGLSVTVAFTSLLDLFVNRLLFRAGPEFLAHVQFPGVSQSAVVGRISFTFEQMTLYVVLGSAAILLAGQHAVLSRCIGLLLVPQLACAALLYLPLPLGLAWAASLLLVLVTGLEVVSLLLMRALKAAGAPGKRLVAEFVFLSALALSFIFPIYYRIALLLGAVNAAVLPFEGGMYYAGIIMIMFTAVAALAAALVAPSPGFKMTLWNFTKATV
jgi:hypothetical protein